MFRLKSTGLMALGVVFAQLLAVTAEAKDCKAIHADLIETRTSEGCDAGLSSCFIGAVNGNHGLRRGEHRALNVFHSMPKNLRAGQVACRRGSRLRNARAPLKKCLTASGRTASLPYHYN